MYHLQNGKEHIYALHVCYVGYLRMLNSILKEERNILQGLNIISFFSLFRDKKYNGNDFYMIADFLT